MPFWFGYQTLAALWKLSLCPLLASIHFPYHSLVIAGMLFSIIIVLPHELYINGMTSFTHNVCVFIDDVGLFTGFLLLCTFPLNESIIIYSVNGHLNYFWI